MKGVFFNQIKEDDNFLSVSLQVMEAISLAISCLNDVGELTKILKTLGILSNQGLVDANFDISECFFVP